MIRLEQTRVWLTAFFAFMLVVWGLSKIQSVKDAALRATTISGHASGLHTFFNLKDAAVLDSATSLRHAVLSREDLNETRTLLIASPEIPLSIREEGIIKSWVKDGGQLVLAFHNETTRTFLDSFLKDADFSPLIGEVPGFQNEVTRAIVVKNPGAFVALGETYEFYSRLRFQDAICLEDEIECYMRTKQDGQGSVTVFVGIPPFANGLIARSDNNRLSARLALATGNTLFDDFHLLISEKTFFDLLKDPTFFLPMIGLLIGVFLFFAASNDELKDSELALPPDLPQRSFHAFNRLVLRRVVTEPGALKDAVQRHARFLLRLMPEKRELIEKTALSAGSHDIPAKQAAIRLIMQHQAWLKSRGRK